MVLWNAVFGYGSLAVSVARNLLLVPVYLHFVPLGEYGAWLATGGALAQLLVTDYGLSGVVTQRIAAASGAGSEARLRELIAAGVVNALLLGGLLGVAGLLISAFLPATQGFDATTVRRIGHCFLIAVLANAIGVLGSTAAAAVRGLQKPVAAGAATLGADLASVIVTLAGLFAGLGLYALALGLAARSVLLTLGCAGVLARCRLPGGPGFSWAVSRQLWRDAARFFVTSIAMRLMSQANVLAVGVVLGPATAAIYSLTVRAHETVLTVLAQLHGALGPALAHLAGGGRQAQLDSVIGRVLPFSAAAAALGAACVAVLNPAFVSLWVGEHAYAGIAVTAIMSLALWIWVVGSVAYEALLARGEFARIARGYATAAVVHVLLLVPCIHFGMAVAPAALAFSTAVWAGTFWHRLGFSMTQARMLLSIAAAALLGSVVLRLFVRPVHGWLAFAATAMVVAIAIGALLLAASPALRRVLSDESSATLRQLRRART